MKFFLVILLSLVGNLAVMAQQITVKGKVVDVDGNPLPGVMFSVDDKLVNVTSNRDGIYSLKVPSEKSKITVYYVGYETYTVTVGKQTTINITLHEISKEVSEIVVVGYATARRRDLTGSVASVSGAQIEDMPVVSAAQAIAGRMPGVVVTQTEGSLDAEMKFRVRGGGSITQDNSPLFIVDGFPADDINDISPSEISSIDVLKDASSTAIYGARGANGVVIVTTKSGSTGKTKISYNTYYGVSHITNYLDVLSPYEYALWQYEVNPGSNYTSYFGDIRDIDIYKTFSGSDWQKEILGNTGTRYYNNISVSGGTKDIKYNAYISRNDVKDIMMDSGLHQTNIGLKVNIRLKKWLKLDANFRHSNRVILGAGTSSNSRYIKNCYHPGFWGKFSRPI